MLPFPFPPLLTVNNPVKGRDLVHAGGQFSPIQFRRLHRAAALFALERLHVITMRLGTLAEPLLPSIWPYA
jgi:hypothetical protein